MTILKSTSAVESLGSPDVDFASSGSSHVFGSRGRVLVINERRRETQSFGWAMRAMHLESSWVRSGREALAAMRCMHFDVVVIDEKLPDMSAIDVVRALRLEYDSRSFVILRSTLPSPAAAPGEIDREMPTVLNRPYRCADVVCVINSLLGLRASRGYGAPCSSQTEPPDDLQPLPIVHRTAGSIVERWAHLVVGTIDAENDPKTVSKWARTVGVSRSVLSECCRLVHILPQDARDFARVLRAICHCGERWQPETVLDLADSRTLRKVLARAGLSRHVGATPTTPQFLDQQRWIPQNNTGLTALRTLLFDGTRYAD